MTEPFLERLDALRADERRLVLLELPASMVENEDVESLTTLMTSFGFLQRKYAAFGVHSVLEDLQQFQSIASSDLLAGLKAIEAALRLSIPALQHDPAQFATQLISRLMRHPSVIVADFVSECTAALSEGEFRPQTQTAIISGLESSSAVQLPDKVQDLLVSADGARMVATSSKGSVSVWELPPRPDSGVLKFNCPELESAAISPNGRQLVCGDSHGAVTLWDLKTGFQVRWTRPSSERVANLVFVSDDVVCCTKRFGLWFLDRSSLEPLTTVDVEMVAELGAVGEHHLLVGTHDGWLDLWDGKAKRRLAEMGFHGSYKPKRMTDAELFAHSMLRSPMWMSSGPGSDPVDLSSEVLQQIDQLAGVTQEEAESLRRSLDDDPFKDAVSAIAKDVDGAELAVSGSMNGELKVFELDERRVLCTCEGHTTTVNCCALSSRRGLLISGAADGTIRIWSIPTAKEIATLNFGSKEPVALYVFAHSDALLMAFADGIVRYWEVFDSASFHRDFHGLDAVRALANFDSYLYGISGSAATTWSIDAATRIDARQLQEAWGGLHALTPDGRRVVSGKDAHLTIWDVASSWPIHRLAGDWSECDPPSPGHAWHFQEVAVSSDLTRLVAYSLHQTIPAFTNNISRLELWNPSQNRLVTVLDSEAGNITSIQISADGRWAATAGSKAHAGDERVGELRVWDLEHDRLAHEFQQEGVSCLAFSDASDLLIWRSGFELLGLRLAVDDAPRTLLGDLDQWFHVRLLGPRPLLVIVRGRTVEMRELNTGERIAAYTADAQLTTTAGISTGLAVSDVLGTIHFLSTSALEALPAPLDDATRLIGERTGDALGARLDTARRAMADNRPAAAYELWREIGLHRACLPELRVAVARELATLGEADSAAAILLGILRDDELDLTTRLSATRDLEPYLDKHVVDSVAAGASEPRVDQESHSDSFQLYLYLLERLLAQERFQILETVAEDNRLGALARIAAAQALARHTPEAGIEMLLSIATGPGSTATGVLAALQGLRHLLTPSRWFTLVADILPAGGLPPGHALMLAVTAMRVATAGTALLEAFPERFDGAFDLGILTSCREISNTAVFLADRGNLDEANRLLDRAVVAHPGHAYLHANLAGLLIRQKRFEEAIENASEAIRIDVEYHKALNFRAFALMQLNRYELALEDLNRILRSDAEEPTDLANRAYCLHALGRHDQATRDEEASQRLLQGGPRPASGALEFGRHFDPVIDGRALRLNVDSLIEKLGCREELAARLSACLFDPAFPDFARQTAHARLHALRLVQEPTAAGHQDVFDEGGHGTPISSDESELEGLEADQLEAMALDVTQPPQLRATAAAELLSHLTTSEVLELVRRVNDFEPKNDAPPDGVWVVGSLLKGVADRAGEEELSALAADRDLPPWTREIALEVVGTYFDPARAVELSEQLGRESIDDTKLVSLIASSRDQFRTRPSERTPDLRGHPEAIDAYRQFLEAPDEEAVEDLARRLSIITDPEFIEQIEFHLRFKARPEHRDALQRKLNRLKTLPPDPAQLAFRAFARATSLSEMKEVAHLYPAVTTESFQSMISETVAGDISEEDWPAYKQRLAWLRSIPADPVQAAMEAFFRADSLEELRLAAAEHPAIRTSQFPKLVERTRVEGSLPVPLGDRIEWLKALPRDPQDELLDRGYKALADGRFGEAVEALSGVESTPLRRRPHLSLGAALLGLDEHDRAIAEFTKSLEIQPSAVAFERRGNARFLTNRLSEAVDDFSRAVELDPDYVDGWVGRGLAFLKLEKWPETIKSLRHAEALSPGDNMVLFSLAIAHASLSQFAEARQVLASIEHPDADQAAQIAQMRLLLDHQSEEDPAKSALDAFLRARDDRELVAALQQHPLLAHPKFLDELHRYVERQVPETDRPILREKVEHLIAHVRNPAQLAFEALLDAAGDTGIRSAIEEHPMLRESEFLTALDGIAKSIEDPATAQRLVRQLSLLRQMIADGAR